MGRNMLFKNIFHLTSNLPSMASKFGTVAMFATANLQMTFHTQWGRMRTGLPPSVHWLLPSVRRWRQSLVRFEVLTAENKTWRRSVWWKCPKDSFFRAEYRGSKNYANKIVYFWRAVTVSNLRILNSVALISLPPQMFDRLACSRYWLQETEANEVDMVSDGA
jgi:hypothetical protein